MHSARLEGVLSALWPAVTSGDTDAARIVLRTRGGLAKLFGLTALARVAIGAPINEVEFANEAARLIESIARLGGGDDLSRSMPGGAGRTVLDDGDRTALPRESNEFAHPPSSRKQPIITNCSKGNVCPNYKNRVTGLLRSDPGDYWG